MNKHIKCRNVEDQPVNVNIYQTKKTTTIFTERNNNTFVISNVICYHKEKG